MVFAGTALLLAPACHLALYGIVQRHDLVVQDKCNAVREHLAEMSEGVYMCTSILSA